MATEAGIDQLALRRTDPNTQSWPPQSLASDKVIQRLNAERELARDEPAFRAPPALPEATEITWHHVVRAIDDS